MASFGRCRDRDSKTETAEVYGIYFDPSYWRQGAGRVLWSRVMAELACDGFADATVWVLEANDRASRFYEAVGGILDPGVTNTTERGGVPLREVRYRHLVKERQSAGE